jgi:hypothetical protein
LVGNPKQLTSFGYAGLVVNGYSQLVPEKLTNPLLRGQRSNLFT